MLTNYVITELWNDRLTVPTMNVNAKLSDVKELFITIVVVFTEFIWFIDPLILLNITKPTMNVWNQLEEDSRINWITN